MRKLILLKQDFFTINELKEVANQQLLILQNCVDHLTYNKFKDQLNFVLKLALELKIKKNSIPFLPVLPISRYDLEDQWNDVISINNKKINHGQVWLPDKRLVQNINKNNGLDPYYIFNIKVKIFIYNKQKNIDLRPESDRPLSIDESIAFCRHFNSHLENKIIVLGSVYNKKNPLIIYTHKFIPIIDYVNLNDVNNLNRAAIYLNCSNISYN